MAMSFTARSVGLIAVAAMAIGWFGSTLTHDSVPQQSRVSSGVRPIGGAAPAVPRAEKLREQLAKPPLPQRGRNPFVYGSRAPMRTTSRDRSPEIAAPAAPQEPPPPALPVFRLSGIASDVKDGATILTAIINDNGSLVFAKTGDKLSNGYSVVKVEEMSVTLVDASGVTQTIRMP
jgi:hypothetical protein